MVSIFLLGAKGEELSGREGEAAIKKKKDFDHHRWLQEGSIHWCSGDGACCFQKEDV